MDDSLYIPWNNTFMVGVSTLDTDHRILWEAYNTFIQVATSGRQRTAIGYAISAVENYASYHFQKEEQFMQDIGYDRLAEHAAEHIAFIQSIHDIQRGDWNDPATSHKLVGLLRDKIQRHFLSCDGDIARYLTDDARRRDGGDAEPAGSFRIDTPALATLAPSRSPDCITVNGNQRMSTRYAVNLPCYAVNGFGRSFEAMVTNMSVYGARIDGRTSGFFRGSTGLLRFRTIELCDLPFTVVGCFGDYVRVQFNLSPRARSEMSDAFTAPQARRALVGEHGVEEREVEAEADEMGTDLDIDGIGDHSC